MQLTITVAAEPLSQAKCLARGALSRQLTEQWPQAGGSVLNSSKLLILLIPWPICIRFFTAAHHHYGGRSALRGRALRKGVPVRPAGGAAPRAGSAASAESDFTAGFRAGQRAGFGAGAGCSGGNAAAGGGPQHGAPEPIQVWVLQHQTRFTTECLRLSAAVGSGAQCTTQRTFSYGLWNDQEFKKAPTPEDAAMFV